MGRSDTAQAFARLGALFSILAIAALGQSQPTRLDWRRLGNSSQVTGLASAAGGPVDRAWFLAGGGVGVRLSSGRTMLSDDLETWRDAGAVTAPSPATANPPQLPEPAALARTGSAATLYAAGRHAWRSDDGGLNWRNLTDLRGESILGSALKDLAVDPSDPERILAAAGTGLWLSVDGGMSWQGLNDSLPNLPVRRILAAPRGSRGVRIAVSQPDGGLRPLEWAPAQRLGWISAEDRSLAAESDLRDRLSAQLGSAISTVAASGDTVYAGDSAGRLWASVDSGRNFRSFALPDLGRVERIWIDPADRSVALAAIASATPGGARVLRTLNAGTYWDDLTSNLPDGPAYGVAADRATGAIYVASAAGLFLTYGDLRAPASSTQWQPLSAGLPAGPVRDVRIDDAGNLLLAAVDDYGIYTALAPHRTRAPQVVHSADYASRAAAPGALLSVVGARVSSATANNSPSTVLSAGDAESQIQVPFEASGDSLQVVVNAAQGRLVFGLPLQTTAPAVLVDRDGSPMLIDADSGVQLDIMHPSRAGMRVQILMSGLGRVRPEWPTGLPAPLEDAPKVTAPLRASLDGIPLEIARATLAPGYIGYYLVEVVLPEVLNSGASELLVEASGVPANRVRVYVGQ